MKKAKKIFATLSFSAMMFNVVATPVAAQSLDLSVVGNGVESDNVMVVSTDQNTEVSQNNDTNVVNNVKVNSSTGSNSADRNTNGDVAIGTGNATSQVSVTNVLGSNEAEVDCCESQDVTVTIGSEDGNNGDSTDNTVVLNKDNKVKLNQNNRTNVVNNIDNNSSTGWNRADRNSGANVEVGTGNASSTSTVTTGGNVNSAVIGGGNGGNTGVSAMIVGNGVHSDNNIRLNLDNDVRVDQDNSARVVNNVDTDAVTGKNSASRNTGGDAIIGTGDGTGDATVDVVVDNAVNFNFADVDCGCLFEVNAKIASNGDSSDNSIKATLDDDLEVAQDNSCGGSYSRPVLVSSVLSKFFDGYGRGGDCLTNDIYADAYSGFNDVDRNTGGSETDPSVETGAADASVDVINTGSSNVFGEMPEWEFPSDDDSEVSVNISFDLLSLLGMLGISMNS